MLENYAFPHLEGRANAIFQQDGVSAH